MRPLIGAPPDVGRRRGTFDQTGGSRSARRRVTDGQLSGSGQPSARPTWAAAPSDPRLASVRDRCEARPGRPGADRDPVREVHVATWGEVDRRAAVRTRCRCSRRCGTRSPRRGRRVRQRIGAVLKWAVAMGAPSGQRGRRDSRPGARPPTGRRPAPAGARPRRGGRAGFVIRATLAWGDTKLGFDPGVDRGPFRRGAPRNLGRGRSRRRRLGHSRHAHEDLRGALRAAEPAHGRVP